jgi:hypothetical protein
MECPHADAKIELRRNRRPKFLFEFSAVGPEQTNLQSRIRFEPDEQRSIVVPKPRTKSATTNEEAVKNG